jgi:hypothetical protein
MAHQHGTVSVAAPKGDAFGVGPAKHCPAIRPSLNSPQKQACCHPSSRVALVVRWSKRTL